MSHQFGWVGEIAEREFARLSDHFKTFRISGNARTEPGPHIWEYAKRINGGKHLPTWYQQTGDCVSMGMTQAGQYLHCYEIAKLGDEEKFRYWFPPFIYGVSRTAPDCGNGQLGGQAGSTGAWAAVAVQKYGVLFSDDQGCPQYSGGLADNWGRRVPQEFYPIAKERLIRSAARLSSVEQIREALINYKPCTIASNRGFEMQPREYKGYHVFTPSGSWPHQMSLLAWMDDPFPAGYRMNSWGSDSHGKPLNGEPAGGAWNLAEDLEKELRSGDIEVYALSMFDGFPGEANFHLF